MDAELTTGGLGGPLMIESLANILAVRLLRYIFGLRRLVTRSDGVLTRRKLTTIIDYTWRTYTAVRRWNKWLRW